VRFMGFDMQYNLKNETYDILDAYLSKVDSNLFRKKRSLFDLLKNYELTRKIDFNRDSCYQAFLEIVGALVNSEAYYKRTFGTQSYLEALEAATLISQFLHVRLMNPDDPRRAERNWRDQYMANNLFKYIEQHPTSRIMVWAHNAHVAADPALVVNGGPKPLGSYLRNAFKDAYYAIGFSFNKGGFRANKIDDGKVLGVQPITVPEAREGSLDHLLSRAVSRFFLDFRQPMPGYMHSFLSSPIAARDNGDTYSDKFDFFPIGITRKKYDAIIFIDTTTPSISK
jgi:erythromycin esterase